MGNLLKKIKSLWIYFFAFIGGAIMPFAFSPYDFGIAAIASPAILLWCLIKCRPAKAFLLGWIYGIGMFGLGVNWVYVSIHDYGYTTPLLASLFTALFVFTLALFPAMMCALLNKLFPRNDGIRSLLAFPSLWVFFEMLRGWILTGFPWLFVGYSQMGTRIEAFAPLGSVWAVSWAAVFTASIFFSIADYYYHNRDNKKLRNKLILSLIVLWGAAFGLYQVKWTQPTGQQLNVALVQGNIPQLMRWDAKYIASIIDTYQTLTQRALKANIVVWPEGAIPIPLPESEVFFQKMQAFALQNNIALLTGVPSQLAHKEQYYNSLLGLGLAQGIYHKTHLVPFGEYVPLEKWLRGLIAFFNLPMSSFISGPQEQAPITLQGFSFAPDQTFRLAPAICYEIAYPLYVQSLSQQADFILTVSNDTWFGKSIGPAQHLQIAQFRALETGRSVIRATNTGYTAVIDPTGDIQTIAPQFATTVLFGEIKLMQGQTPWVRFGIWPLLGFLGVLLGLALFLRSLQKD